MGGALGVGLVLLEQETPGSPPEDSGCSQARKRGSADTDPAGPPILALPGSSTVSEYVTQLDVCDCGVLK